MTDVDKTYLVSVILMKDLMKMMEDKVQKSWIFKPNHLTPKSIGWLKSSKLDFENVPDEEVEFDQLKEGKYYLLWISFITSVVIPFNLLDF